jgi:hypothetical protein
MASQSNSYGKCLEHLTLVLIYFLLVFMSSCTNKTDERSQIFHYFQKGDFTRAELKIEELLGSHDLDSVRFEEYSVLLEKMNRIRKEFALNVQDVKKSLAKYYPDLTDSMLVTWEEDKQLEMRIIDGEKRYFKRGVNNFFRLNSEAKELKETIDGKEYDGVKDFQQTVVRGYFTNDIQRQVPFDSQKIKVDYTIRLKPNAVPNGEIVKCWLPYPRLNSARLTKIDFLGASQKDYMLSPESSLQRTLYMEKPAVKDTATVFSVSYAFTAAAQWFDVQPEMIKPYDKSAELYKKYTAERLPNIVFSEEIIKLAKQIVGNETNPVEQVKKIFYWIDENIIWAGALEYSVMECIPEYVLEHKKGDCGMQTFLFLSLARSLGIPCKWQSGWYLLPQEKNLHDWAEVYYEGVGWVPVDQSFGLIDSENTRIREFYLNGLDSYRLIINDDYAQELFPPKRYYRSEPYDFQRGELEWKGGNLYFDKWSYKMIVEYLD